MKYTQVRADTFQHLQINAGIILREFDPATGEYDPDDILGSTTGGFQFAANPTFQDFGEDIDNVPPNTWQLKRIQYYDPAISGTFLSVDKDRLKSLVGAADIDPNDSKHIVPRGYLKESDFEDVWVVGDYSDKNTGADAGYLAIHLEHILNTASFQWTTTKDGKAQFSFDKHAHYDLNNIDKIPFEIYCKEGSSAPANPYIFLSRHTVSLVEDDVYTLTAETYPTDATITWSSASTSVASVSDGEITAEGAGNTIITASITKDGVTYSDTCTVIVTAKTE